MRKALLEDDRLKEDLRKYAKAKDQAAVAMMEEDASSDIPGNALGAVLDDVFDEVFVNAEDQGSTEDQVCDAADGASSSASDTVSSNAKRDAKSNTKASELRDASIKVSRQIASQASNQTSNQSSSNTVRESPKKTSGKSSKKMAADQAPVSLEQLIDHASVWRGVQPKGANGRNFGDNLSTGYPILDKCLPGGGWPRASLTEILVPQPGCGELQLVLPALTSLSQTHADEARRWISWIAPPYVPYAPALATAGIDLSRMLLVHAKAGLDIMWSAEQALRSGTCAAVLVWAPKVNNQTLRRLQLAAEEGDSWGIVFRSLAARREASPAAVRLQLAFDERGKTLHLLKSRGGRPLRMAADFLTP